MDARNLVQPFDHEASPFVEFRHHGGDERFALVERRDGGLLRHGIGIRRALALHGAHRGNHIHWSGRVADAPAGHRIGLGDTVHDDGPGLHVLSQ